MNCSFPKMIKISSSSHALIKGCLEYVVGHVTWDEVHKSGCCFRCRVVWYNLWFIHTYVICLQYYYVSIHESPFSPYENADNVKIATDILIVNLQSWKTREQGTRCWNLVHAIFFVVVRCDEILENIMQEKHKNIMKTKIRRIYSYNLAQF